MSRSKPATSATPREDASASSAAPGAPSRSDAARDGAAPDAGDGSGGTSSAGADGTGAGVAPEGGAGECGPAPLLPPGFFDQVVQSAIAALVAQPPAAFSDSLAARVMADPPPAMIEGLAKRVAEHLLQATPVAPEPHQAEPSPPVAPVEQFTRADLAHLHDVPEGDIYAANLVTGAIVTTGGQKLQLA
jgi:hypothetical protein